MICVDLDLLCEQFENPDFIYDDPIQFPHLYVYKKDIEIAGFLASVFAYGKRDAFIEKLNFLFEAMGNSPLEFLKNFNPETSDFKGFDYRFSKSEDLINLLKILSKLYQNSSLEELFAYGYEKTKTIKGMLQVVVDYFYSNCDNLSKGFCHLLPNPQKNSALKRFNMYLRWMVRGGCVDLGIWSFIKPVDLFIPLDTHVARISRDLGLLKRTSNDWQAVCELTEALKKFDFDDPIKYDFALFGYGVNN